jgi:phytoene synthase
MVVLDDAALPPPQRLAVAWSPRAVRPTMLALLIFDAHLASLVAGASEPMLGQIRLAWWREQLREAPDARARGCPELDALSTSWRGEETALVTLVDGWEQLLGEAPLPEAAIGAFAQSRGESFAGLARLSGAIAAEKASTDAGRQWALADLAFRVRDAEEKARCRELYLGAALPPRSHLPRALRGLSVLAALALRSIARDEPLLEGRGAALLALRVGLTGR